MRMEVIAPYASARLYGAGPAHVAADAERGEQSPDRDVGIEGGLHDALDVFTPLDTMCSEVSNSNLICISVGFIIH